MKRISLKKICTKIGSGSTPKGGKESYKLAGISIIRSQNILDFRFTSNGLAFIDETQAAKLKNVIIEEKDVLINITGDSVARVCSVPKWALPARVNQHVAILRANPNLLSAEFLKYHLLHNRSKNELLNLSSSGATRNALTKSMLEDFEINLPPLPEQKAIAHILGTLDDKIELNRKMNETLEAMAQAMFKSWFVDFDPVLDNARAQGNEIPEELKAKADRRKEVLASGKYKALPKDIQNLFPASFVFNEELGKWIPEGWEVKEIKDLCLKVQNGGTPKRDVKEYWDNGDIPWLTSGEVRKNIIHVTKQFITETGLKNSSAKWIPKNSTVIAMYGATAGQVAFSTFPMTSNQAICALIPIIGNEYLVYLTIANQVKNLENQARGSAQQNISKGIVEASKVIIPSSELSEYFHEHIEVIFNKSKFLLPEIDNLKSSRDLLLSQLISGKTRLPKSFIQKFETQK